MFNLQIQVTVEKKTFLNFSFLNLNFMVHSHGFSYVFMVEVSMSSWSVGSTGVIPGCGNV